MLDNVENKSFLSEFKEPVPYHMATNFFLVRPLIRWWKQFFNPMATSRAFPADLVCIAGVTAVLEFTIYPYHKCASLDTSYKFKTNFCENPFDIFFKTTLLLQFSSKNTGTSSKAREFVYVEVTHVLEKHRTTSQEFITPLPIKNNTHR